VATEYAVLIAFGVIIMAAGILLFGGDVSQWFEDLGNNLGGAPDLPDVP
jgi:Flp pilus assembly pilin Flp